MPQTSFIVVEIHNVTDLEKSSTSSCFSQLCHRETTTLKEKRAELLSQTRATALIHSTSRYEFLFKLVKKVPVCTGLEYLPLTLICAILVWKLGLKDLLMYNFFITKLTLISLKNDAFVVHYSLHHQTTASKLIQSHGPDESGNVFSGSMI